MNAKTREDAAQTHEPTEAEIRDHAYELFERRGRKPGRDLDDWLDSERHLKSKRAPVALPQRWRWHERTLLRLRAALTAERNEHDLAAREPVERVGDQVDVANEKWEHDTLLAEIKREDMEVAEIDAALERIRNGTYGLCELTGKPIADERLRAIPWTRLSLEAAERTIGP